MKKHTFEHSRKNSPSCQFRERMIKISKIRQFFQRKMNDLQCDKILTVKNYWSNEQPVDFFSRASTLFSSLSLWSPRLFLLKLGRAMFSTILVQISRESKKIFFTWNPSFRKYVQGELENGWAENRHQTEPFCANRNGASSIMVEVLEQSQPWDRWLEAKASSQAANGQISGKTASCFTQNTKQIRE